MRRLCRSRSEPEARWYVSKCRSKVRVLKPDRANERRARRLAYRRPKRRRSAIRRKNMRVLIAEDERNAREFLKSLLEEFGTVETITEASNGAEALKLIREQTPDLVFLDLEMPELTGFEVIRRLDADETPLIAFVTAFDEYAIKAFEVNAVDYLLKPVEPERLGQTLKRAAERLGDSSEHRQAVEGIRQSAGAGSGELEFLPVKTGEEISLVKVDEIASVVADGELLHITTKENKKYLINFRLKDLETRLGEDRFIRLSRGALANVSMLTAASTMPGGAYLVELENGQKIQASRSQSKILRDRLLRL
ncbi:MAG: response regulator [Acidobacteria bacterium]|nr:MAG: response regulator [Acidobacteriota bacterium]REK03991.1 MAG: response regulator [Acidobacteriota bacterium]REK15153.1 MAG: response regulator [Acidobacteriota bacterium]REK46243.1 MAG: response regulator [Acidobacteriota bacterium]